MKYRGSYFLFIVVCFCSMQLTGQNLNLYIKPYIEIETEEIKTLLQDYSIQNAIEIGLKEKLEKRLSSEKDRRVRLVCNTLLGHLESNDDRHNLAFKYLRLGVEDAKALQKQDNLRGFAYAAFGSYLFNASAYDLSIDYLKKSIPYLTTELDRQSFYPQAIANLLVQAFYHLERPDSALYYQNIYIAEVLKRDNLGNVIDAYNNCGLNAYNAGLTERAIELYYKGLKYGKTKIRGEVLRKKNIQESLAHPLFQLGRFDEGMALLKDTYQTRKELGPKKNAVQTWNYIINYFLEFGQETEALRWHIKEFEFIKSCNQSNPKVLSAYPTIIEMLKKTGNQSQASEYALIYTDYLIAKNAMLELREKGKNSLNAFVTDRNEAFENTINLQQRQNEAMAKQISLKNKLLWLSIIFSTIILSFLYFYFKLNRRFEARKRITAEQEKKILALENQNLKKDIHLKESSIRSVAADNKVRTSIKKDILKKLQKLYHTEDSKRSKELITLTHELERAIEDQDQLSHFQDNIEMINAGFETKLKEAIPGISPSELKVCRLVKIGMDNAQIANTLNRTESTVRATKARLRKKAAFDSVGHLEEMVRKI